MKPTQAYLDFIKASKEAHEAFSKMSELYDGLSDEERNNVDGNYPQNLESMDEQALQLSGFTEELIETVPGLNKQYYRGIR